MDGHLDRRELANKKKRRLSADLSVEGKAKLAAKRKAARDRAKVQSQQPMLPSPEPTPMVGVQLLDGLAGSVPQELSLPVVGNYAALLSVALESDGSVVGTSQLPSVPSVDILSARRDVVNEKKRRSRAALSVEAREGLAVRRRASRVRSKPPLQVQTDIHAEPFRPFSTDVSCSTSSPLRDYSIRSSFAAVGVNVDVGITSGLPLVPCTGVVDLTEEVHDRVYPLAENLSGDVVHGVCSARSIDHFSMSGNFEVGQSSSASTNVQNSEFLYIDVNANMQFRIQRSTHLKDCTFKYNTTASRSPIAQQWKKQ